MASPNTEALRLAQARLEPRRRFVVRRSLIPITEKTTSGKERKAFRLRVSLEDQDYALDQASGAVINPARRMSEADRRALGLRRNGQPRRRGRAPLTPDRKIAA
jgi:hypothetical protein